MSLHGNGREKLGGGTRGQKVGGVTPPRCPPCHSLGVAAGTNLPAEPMEPALGSHTAARRPQSREIMNTWGLLSPTSRASGRPPSAAPKGRNSISQGQSHSTCAKAARHRSCQECPGCSSQGRGCTAPIPQWGGWGGPVPLTATKPPSHKATGDPVPSVPDHCPLLRHGGWSRSQANLGDTSCN